MKPFPNSTHNCFHHDGDVKIVRSKLDHAKYLQDHLRLTDIRECMIHSATPWRALPYPLRRKDSDTWTGLYKDVPAVMFGVVPINGDNDIRSGQIWLLGTDEIDKHARKFMRSTVDMLNYIQRSWYTLENVVPIEHQKTLNFLHFLGFEFSDNVVNINGFACVRFVRCNPNKDLQFG